MLLFGLLYCSKMYTVLLPTEISKSSLTRHPRHQPALADSPMTLLDFLAIVHFSLIPQDALLVELCSSSQPSTVPLHSPPFHLHVPWIPGGMAHTPSSVGSMF